ncbi:hypothetical protein AVEN_230404-2-1, partial [Araneus ventricosus]
DLPPLLVPMVASKDFLHDICLKFLLLFYGENCSGQKESWKSPSKLFRALEYCGIIVTQVDNRSYQADIENI